MNLTLKGARANLNLSQKQMAGLLGITRSKYGEIERDPGKARADTIRAIIKVLGLTPAAAYEMFFGGSAK
ncbi:MAG: helix-turn-helix transcriptional regulator [Coriobacteriia bacterium]|nr:helix-turn-helix transcriptional regulator [Coriobacteriia bacterium]